MQPTKDARCGRCGAMLQFPPRRPLLGRPLGDLLSLAVRVLRAAAARPPTVYTLRAPPVPKREDRAAKAEAEAAEELERARDAFDNLETDQLRSLNDALHRAGLGGVTHSSSSAEAGVTLRRRSRNGRNAKPVTRKRR
jgi:hypothetical protein